MPGATGGVATRHVYALAPDGHNWIFAAGYNRGLRTMGFDNTVPYLDWQYFGADSSLMSLAVHTDSPIRDIDDLLRTAHDRPRPLGISVGGYGGSWHLAVLLLMRASGTRFRVIPYDGGKPAVVAGLNGEVDVVCCGLYEQISFLKQGLLRHLATGGTRSMTLDGVSLSSITDTVPALLPQAPLGGGSTLALRRDVDPGILKKIDSAWRRTISSAKTRELTRARGRLIDMTTGEKADRRAALLETQAANLLHETGMARYSPADLGLPTIEEFDNWWPPRRYRPRI